MRDFPVGVVAKGSNEFAPFIALGVWSGPSPASSSGINVEDRSEAGLSPLTLARRYLEPRDPRVKMSHEELLAERWCQMKEA